MRSADAVTMWVPSGENRADETSIRWPRSVNGAAMYATPVTTATLLAETTKRLRSYARCMSVG